MKVLVIDDEKIFLLGIKKFLENPEIMVDTAETFEDAMYLLNNSSYNAVIVDIRLSGTSGEEGLDILRYIKKYKPDKKVIVITGYGDQEIRQKAYDLGADFYYEKPVSAEVLLKSLLCKNSDKIFEVENEI
ncbi:MAG: response regulator [Nitrospirota bacterium]